MPYHLHQYCSISFPKILFHFCGDYWVTRLHEAQSKTTQCDARYQKNELSPHPVWSGLIYLAWEVPPKAAVTCRQIRWCGRQHNILTYFLQNFHWVSRSVLAADPSCWKHTFWTINHMYFSDVTVTVMPSSSHNKQGTIITQHTASHHCQIFTVKRSMVEWNSILQNNLSSVYWYTEREVCFVCQIMKTNSPPPQM
jgi:hypothetical protein